jgi:hypothetical protein
MTNLVNLSPPVRQLSLVFLMFVLSSSAAAEEAAVPSAKPDAPAFTVGPAVPLSAAQRAALATKRAATVTGTPARASVIAHTKPLPFSFTGGPAGEVTLKSLPSSDPTAASEADAVEALVRVQGRNAAANAGLLKTVAGRDELAKPAQVSPQSAPRTNEHRSATTGPVLTSRARGGR